MGSGHPKMKKGGWRLKGTESGPETPEHSGFEGWRQNHNSKGRFRILMIEERRAGAERSACLVVGRLQPQGKCFF